MSQLGIRRLQKEYKAILKENKKGGDDVILCHPHPENLFKWFYLLIGPKDTPYEGGFYYGKLIFPETYPHAPPSIIMCTPNGRFETDTRLCLSMSDFHKESWNPMWNVSTIVRGILSFMCETQNTAGAINTSLSTKRKLATQSLAFNLRKQIFRDLFVAELEKTHGDELAAARAINEALKQQKAGGGDARRFKGMVETEVGDDGVVRSKANTLEDVLTYMGFVVVLLAAVYWYTTRTH